MRRPRIVLNAATVLVLVTFEVTALRLLLLLGRVDGFSADRSDPLGWARRAGTVDLLAATGRLVGLILATWLLAGTLASLARRAVPAWREVQALDALSLPVVRHALDRLLAVSLGASTLLGSAATAASASTPPSSVPSPTPRPPATAVVTIGADGEVTVLPASGGDAQQPGATAAARTEKRDGSPADLSGESLVIRAPAPTPGPAATSPTATSTTSPTTTSPPSASGASDSPAPTASHPSTPTTATPAARAAVSAPGSGVPAAHYTIRPGDSLWLVAEHQVAASGPAAAPDERAVARYWLALVDANRATLRSGNPGLVYPGEVVVLPQVPARPSRS